MPFDPLTDLAPVTQLVTLPFVLATHPSVPVKTVRELIALAKSSPKGLTYGSSGTGGGAHLAGEMMKNMTGINITHIPYKGGAPAITGLLSGEVDFMFISILTVTPLLKDNRLRPIAVTSPARNKSLPNIPSMSELPGAERSGVGPVVRHDRAREDRPQGDRAPVEGIRARARAAGFQEPVRAERHRARREFAGRVREADQDRIRPLGQSREGGRHEGGLNVMAFEAFA